MRTVFFAPDFSRPTFGQVFSVSRLPSSVSRAFPPKRVESHPDYCFTLNSH